MTATCPVCDSPQDQGLMCSRCTDVIERELGDVSAIVHELDVTLSRQARIGGGGKAGPAHERTPAHLGAMTAADDLGNTLTTWARDVAERPEECTCGHDDLPAHFHMTPCPIKVAYFARLTLERPVVTKPSLAAARALLSSIPAIRRHPAAAELHDEILDAVRTARRAVDRPADRVYLGQCFYEDPDTEVVCYEEQWARAGASTTTCKVCGIEHDVAERRAWLLKRAEDMLFTVREASEYVGEVGHIKVTQASIRSYLHRGRIAYRPGNRIRLGDLLTVVLDDGERKSA